MRNANLSRIKQNMSDPDWIAARLYNDRAYEGHPYALNSGGTLSTLASITPEMLRAYHQKYFTKNRLHIGVTGDITKEDLQDIINSIFGNLPNGAPPKAMAPLDLKNQGGSFIYPIDIPQSVVNIAYPSISIHDKDYFAARVMNYILGGAGFGSRLMERAREKEGLTYGIYSSLNHLSAIDLLKISTSTQNETREQMLGSIKDEIQQLIDHGVTETELQKAKDYLIGSLPLSLTSSDQISALLLSLQLNDRDIDYLDHYADQINRVTTKDIQSIAKIILDKKPLIIIVGKEDKIKNSPLTSSFTAIERLPNVE